MSAIDCPLCRDIGGLLVAQSPSWRVVRVTDTPAFPAFYRLIWHRHQAEFSDLDTAERGDCMAALVRIETVLRQTLAPTKINLASLGNVVPHLHWHVIARFDWDSHFPNPIWGEARRVVDAAAWARFDLLQLDRRMTEALSV